VSKPDHPTPNPDPESINTLFLKTYFLGPVL
jgi:hypothetical protein